MGNVIKYMGNEVPETFLGYDILLAANMAKTALNHCSAV
jgi:hypothetical protein